MRGRVPIVSGLSAALDPVGAMSHPYDNSGRSWSVRSATLEPDEAGPQDENYPFQPLGQPSSTHLYDYNTPQSSTFSSLERSNSHQTSTPLSSGYHFQVPASDGFAPNLPGGPYVRGAAYSINNHESHQSILEGEHQHSVSSNGGGPHGYNGQPGGNSTRRHRDDPEFYDADEEMSLEIPRNQQMIPNLPPPRRHTHGRRPTLIGIGDHLDSDRTLNQSDPRIDYEKLLIYGNSSEFVPAYTNQHPVGSPESLASSLASLSVNVGSAPG